MENVGPVSGVEFHRPSLFFVFLLFLFQYDTHTTFVCVAGKAGHFSGPSACRDVPMMPGRGRSAVSPSEGEFIIMPAERRKVMQSQDPFVPNVPGNGGK